MKKVLLMVLFVSLAVTMTFAGGATDENEQGATITVLTHRTDLADSVLYDAKLGFEAAYADYGWTVDFENITDYEGDVTTRIGGGAYGDVLMIPNAVEKKDLSAVFKPLGTIEEVSKDWRGIINGKHDDNMVYGLPTMVNTSGIIYNTELFKKAGVQAPKTPEEFIEVMKVLKKDNKDNPDFVAYYTNFGAGWTLDQWTEGIAAAAGNPEYYPNEFAWDREAFTTGPAAQAYGMMYDLVIAGVTEKDPTTTEWERSKIELVRGNIGAMVLGGWAIKQLQDIAVGLGYDSSVIGYMPFPYADANGVQYATISPDYSIGIAANTEFPKAAETFLYWLMEDFDFCAKAGGLIPSSVKNPYPAIVQSFQDNGVVFFENAAPKVPDALPTAEKMSTMGLWTAAWKTIYIENAFKVREGQKGLSKAEVGRALQDKWDKGVDAVIEEFGNKPE